MHPAVLAPQSAAMVPYPVFGSPVGIRQLDYHPMMFPFPHQLAMHAQAGAFQYALAGIPFQPHHQNMLSDRSPKSAKDSHSPGQTRHSFTIDSILNSKEKTRDSSSPDNSPVCRKISASNRRHERMKALSLPYSRSPQRGGDFGEPVSHTNLHSGLHETGEKSGRGGEWKGSRSKRIRTIFTPEQLERLEAEFERQQYMVGTERYYLATELSLTEAQVKVWFQNRRIKWRKQTLEKQQAQLAASDVYRGLDSDSEDDRTSSGADRETAELSARRESAGEVSADMDSARELTANRNSAGEISPDREVRTSQCFSNELCSTRNIQLPKSPSND